MKSDHKDYHHGSLRETLLRTAVHHLQEYGIEKLSLRAMAREIKVSQTAPYRHFKDKNALLAALATQGFEQLIDRTRQAITEAGDDSAAQLQACGIAYISFARENADLYRLMFGQGIIDRAQYKTLAHKSEQSFHVLNTIISTGIEQGVFSDQPEQMLACTAWALVHGLCDLILEQTQWPMSDETIDEQIRVSTRLLITGIKAC